MTENQVLAQREQGYRRLRFIPELERAFQEDRAQMMRERARPVAASALLLFLFYSVLDWWFFPASLSSQTVAVRLLVICPIILSVLILSYRLASARAFAYYYILSYLWGGLSLLFIIWLSRRQSIDMPYDGVLLMLMFGFFLMGLPFRSVTLTSTVVVGLYIGLEIAVDAPPRKLMFNGFFLTTAYLIGVVGAWLQEYQLRTHFLDRTQLALSRTAAQRENARKTDVLAAAGHDLRQPLNVIRLQLENLAAEREEQARAGLMDQLGQNLDRYERLLGSLLDLSRLREGVVRPQLAMVMVWQLLEDLRISFDGQARARNLRIEPVPRTSLGVTADPALLHRVLQNLVSNALAHSGGDTLSFEIASQFGQVRIWVKDNGRGVPKASEQRLFEAFYRGEDRQAGLGLGLAIVQQLVRLMSGRCGYEPGERGSCFWVELPRADTGAISVSPAAPGSTATPWWLLVVEDDDSARRELELLTRGWGCEVAGFKSAELALDSVWLKQARQAGRPFVLLTDLHLPGASGFELAAAIRQWRPALAAVVMTADATERPRYDHASHTWVLQKPLAAGRLRAALTRLAQQA